MKKILTLIGIAIVSAIAMTGCGQKEADADLGDKAPPAKEGAVAVEPPANKQRPGAREASEGGGEGTSEAQTNKMAAKPDGQ